MFKGFASLRSLVLDDVEISTKTLLHLLSNSPSLKRFSLISCYAHIDGICCTIIDLFKCLPVIEHLTTCYDVFEWLVLDTVPKELPTLLFHLRYFCFDYMCFMDGYGLAFLLILIKCSPNLQKVKLEIVWEHECDGEWPPIHYFVSVQQKEQPKMKKKRAGKATQLSMDRISTLPQPILEIIISLLPTTKEAARTSILSREWRYKWNKIPKLKFDNFDLKMHVRSTKTNTRCKYFSDVHQVLLLRQGPVHELTIHICEGCDRYELDEIILHLAKNHTIKKLTVYGWDFRAWFKLPISVFLLHHLADLYLCSVNLDHQPIFNGFASLRSLVLHDVRISAKSLLHLLSNCPSLKSFRLTWDDVYIDDIHCTVIELFKCLPVIEHLTTCYDIFKWLILDSVPKALPTSLFHLRYFRFDICFKEGYGLAFLLILIRCSPNLQKINLEIEPGHECDGEYVVVWEDYSDVWLEHLHELEIEYFANSKPEMDFVKFILARSPKLKNVRIRSAVYREDSKMLKTLLEAPRASPVIITVR
ncbi:hypothetical protein SSX86_025507 [Deinandra increscens subsp. villosa]|uniref:F-box/LRR-repeat protein 15/At3g58940/PEG3-like LRR domain-containing protein n=1 Tax=Deinandra increscens subsp. villosa TaxID=3103831 RepID=A0AAP0CJL3_9ASTR